MGSCGSEVGEVTTPTLRDQGKKIGRVNQGENPKYEQKIEEEMQGNITSSKGDGKKQKMSDNIPSSKENEKNQERSNKITSSKECEEKYIPHNIKSVKD